MSLVEIENGTIQTIYHSLPFVLLDVFTRQYWSTLLTLIKPIELSNERLTECCNGKSVLKCRRHITDAKLNGIEKWMGSNIPPDFLAVLDKVKRYKLLNVLLEFFS